MAGTAVQQTVSADDPEKESDPSPLAPAGSRSRAARDRLYRMAGAAAVAGGGPGGPAPVISLPSPGLAGRRDAGHVPISATLAANEALDRKRWAGERVLPMAFGE